MENEFKASWPDPRILIIQVLAVSILASSLQSIFALFLLVLLLDLMMLFFKGWKFFIKSILEYVSAAALLMLLKHTHIPVISDIFPLFILLLLKIYPMYLSARFLIVKAPMNEMFYALEKWKIPKMVLIPLLVIYRYIPTLLKEIGFIRESVKMRNLHYKTKEKILHPLQHMENYLVPLLYRSEKISEELSAAAVCKGLSTVRERSCITDVRFKGQDLIYVCIMAAAAALVLFVEHYVSFM